MAHVGEERGLRLRGPLGGIARLVQGLLSVLPRGDVEPRPEDLGRLPARVALQARGVVYPMVATVLVAKAVLGGEMALAHQGG